MPKELYDLVHDQAKKNYKSVSTYVRDSIVRDLRESGVLDE
jgi:hypothetical protein